MRNNGWLRKYCEMADKPALTVIPGGNKPKRTVRKQKGDLEQWLCRICEHELGVATSALIKVKLSPMTEGLGKIRGGTDAWVCAHCLSRGKVTRV